MDRAEWLASLNEGDDVCYYDRWSGYTIIKITKITPSRQIKTSDGKTWRKGSNGSGWDSRDIEPVTDEIRAKVWRSKSLYTVKSFDFGKLPDDKLAEVLRIIAEVSE